MVNGPSHLVGEAVADEEGAAADSGGGGSSSSSSRERWPTTNIGRGSGDGALATAVYLLCTQHAGVEPY